MGQRYEHFSILEYNLQIFRTLEKDTLWTVSSLLEKLEFIGGFINLLLNIQKCIFAKSLFYERRMHYLQSASGVSE